MFSARLVSESFSRVRIPLRLRFMSSNARANFRGVLAQQLSDIETSGTYKHERVITTPQAARIGVRQGSGGGISVLNFCANNYLGLSDHPDLVDAAKKTLDSHGFGLSSVRFICGTQDIHKELESTISSFHEKEDSILYPSCFDANAGLFEAILSPEDAVFSDSLNHASIIDGLRLCKAKKFRYEHMDLNDLETKLIEANKAGARTKLIVTDGVFSMDGDVAPLDKICDLADKHGALVMTDECHSTGILGEGGRGAPEYHSVLDRVDIINSTLGKALGGASGGFTTGPQEVIDILRNRSRPYLFSNTLAPPIVGASIEVFRKLAQGAELREKLRANTSRFRTAMTEAGFTLSGVDHPIAPVMLGDERLASEMADALLKKGIYVIGFSFPVVPKGKARIRVQISACHEPEHIEYAINAFKEVGKDMGVIP
eukprot:TRINITY_DN16716_c0_g1_i1.p1 TRINITY_DN16716_c0_g1~~TRINITY_DN16716_c0_g1_i1.p1  ORF type:complete len:429 (+),score=80.05 TRINITY_DN16716_c0_g1_i1:128-1414(+)